MAYLTHGDETKIGFATPYKVVKNEQTLTITCRTGTGTVMNFKRGPDLVIIMAPIEWGWVKDAIDAANNFNAKNASIYLEDMDR